MARRPPIIAGLLIVCGAYAVSACSQSEPGHANGEPTVPPMPGVNAPAPGAGVSLPTASGGSGATPMSMMPATGTAGSSPIANQPPAQEPVEPSADPATPADNCQDRRVSYAKPCTNDPNPCQINSGFGGDEYCLSAPAEGKGIQIHIGPTDYADETEVAKYVIAAGDEFNNSVIGPIPTSEQRWFNHMTVHMRPGSHHWISTVVDGKPEAKFYDDTSCGSSAAVGSIGGGQNLIYDSPPGGVPAPENVGLGRTLPGNASLCMNLHAYNFTDEPQLREMWINIYFVDEADVTQKAQSIGMIGGLGLSLAPGQDKVETYMGTFANPGRIIQLFGHRHVWTPRFAVWLNDALIYESWSWEESATFNYDSLTMNPPIATEMKLDGAASGQIPVKAGDVLKFTCFIENRSDKTLRFSNELYDGEMCNLWGSAVGTGLSGNFR